MTIYEPHSEKTGFLNMRKQSRRSVVRWPHNWSASLFLLHNRNRFLTAKLLKQGYRYHQLRKAISKFYRRHFELIEKYHVSLKKLMQQGISNPEFYGDLTYKFKKIIGNPNFSDLFRRIVKRIRRTGYNLDHMRQTACLVFNPIMVDDYAAIFGCTTVVQAWDSMTALMLS